MPRSFRYVLILVLFTLGTGLAAVAGWRYARASSPVSGPIVLITVDSLRADRLPAFGYAGVPTPAIDALAVDGLVFDRAYAHAPQTLPAHVSLLTGRLPFETGVRDDVGFAVPESDRLLAEMLADRGFATGGVVSSFALRRDTGLSRGFAFFDDGLDGERAADGMPIVSRDGAESEKRAERWLSGVGTSRAFLFLHLDEPRAPYMPPDRFAQYAPYDGEVAYVDELVGRLVAYLKKQQLYEQSTIIFVGDHGESLGAHGERGHGLLVTDETVRVPLIIKQAGGEGAGRRVPDLVQHVDLVPTILDLARAPAPNGLAGRSLRPIFEGGSLPGRVAYAESLFAQYQYGWSPIVSVTDGRFRYVVGPSPALLESSAEASSAGRTDPSPVRSRADETAELAHALKSFEDAAQALRPLEPKPPAVEERERFLALGALGPRAGAEHSDVDATVDPASQARLVASYKAASAAVAAHKWSSAIDQLRALAREHAGMLDLWASLASVAMRAERHDIAIDAYRRILSADADAVDARLGLSMALLRSRRLDDARAQAELAAGDATAAASDRARARELLARIAVAAHDPGGARLQAQHVLEIDPTSQFPSFIEGRLLFERARYDDALPLLDQAAAGQSHDAIVDLHFLRGETLLKLDRAAEAEDAYLAEIESFSENTRAYAALATLYHAQKRDDEAAAILTRLTDVVGTPDAFDVSARLWISFGDRERAAAVRAAAQQHSSPPHTVPTQQ